MLKREYGQVFEERVLRRMFGTKRSEVVGGWSKLLIEELYELYSFTKYY
jgi:hypothetical protein